MGFFIAAQRFFYGFSLILVLTFSRAKIDFVPPSQALTVCQQAYFTDSEQYRSRDYHQLAQSGVTDVFAEDNIVGSNTTVCERVYLTGETAFYAHGGEGELLTRTDLLARITADSDPCLNALLNNNEPMNAPNIQVVNYSTGTLAAAAAAIPQTPPHELVEYMLAPVYIGMFPLPINAEAQILPRPLMPEDLQHVNYGGIIGRSIAFDIPLDTLSPVIRRPEGVLTSLHKNQLVAFFDDRLSSEWTPVNSAELFDGEITYVLRNTLGSQILIHVRLGDASETPRLTVVVSGIANMAEIGAGAEILFSSSFGERPTGDFRDSWEARDWRSLLLEPIYLAESDRDLYVFQRDTSTSNLAIVTAGFDNDGDDYRQDDLHYLTTCDLTSYTPDWLGR